MNSSAAKKVIYTCITENYDKVPLVKPPEGFDYICFLDRATMQANHNEITNSSGVIFSEITIGSMSPQDANRYYKMRPHDFLSQYDESIYIDGNIRVRGSPFELFNSVPPVKSVALYSQPHRNCAYLEMDELVRVGIARGSDAANLKNSMRTLGLPANSGLFEANIIFRRHNDPQCVLLMEMWWKLWQTGSIKRDQPLLAFLDFLTDKKVTHRLGYSKLRENTNPFFFYQGRVFKKNRLRRLIRRIRSEIHLYRRG
jgi:hypothetical protein